MIKRCSAVETDRSLFLRTAMSATHTQADDQVVCSASPRLPDGCLQCRLKVSWYAIFRRHMSERRREVRKKPISLPLPISPHDPSSRGHTTPAPPKQNNLRRSSWTVFFRPANLTHVPCRVAGRLITFVPAAVIDARHSCYFYSTKGRSVGVLSRIVPCMNVTIHGSIVKA